VGALVDKAVTRKVIVYENAAKGAGGNAALTAALAGARRVQVILRF
jgi:hypothetical protein